MAHMACISRNIFIVEIATTGFLVFWLGIGSLFAMITSFLQKT